MMPKNKRGIIKYALMTLFSIATAAGTAVLAFQKSMTGSSVVLLSSAVLLVSSALLGVSIADSSDDTKRTALLVFSFGVLALFCGATWILFSQNEESTSTGQKTEIITPAEDISSNLPPKESIEEAFSDFENSEDDTVIASSPTVSADVLVIAEPEIINVEPRLPMQPEVISGSSLIPEEMLVDIVPAWPEKPALTVSTAVIEDVEARLPYASNIDVHTVILPAVYYIEPGIPEKAELTAFAEVLPEARIIDIEPKLPLPGSVQVSAEILPSSPAVEAEVTAISTETPFVSDIIVRTPHQPVLAVSTAEAIDVIPAETPSEAEVEAYSSIKAEPEIIDITIKAPEIALMKSETELSTDILPRVPAATSVGSATTITGIETVKDIEPRLPEHIELNVSTEIVPDAFITNIEPRVPEKASLDSTTAIAAKEASIDIMPRLPKPIELSVSTEIVPDASIINVEPRIPDSALLSAAASVAPSVSEIIVEPEVEMAEQISEEVYAEPVSEPAVDDFFSGLSPEEAEFWASFYIEGEDELTLADGIYYMDLIVNDSYVGQIEVESVAENIAIRSSELEAYISDSIIDELKDSIFATDDKYIPLSYLEELGIMASADINTYEIFIDFNPSDMPVQVLSIRGNSRRSTFRPITGGLMLDPAVFVLRTNWEFSGYTNSFRYFDWRDSLRFTLSSSNTGRIVDVNFNFSYYLNFTFSSISFRMGTYRFYKDFKDAMIRLSWGNVSSDVLSPQGRAFGIRFDKSYIYGDSNAKQKSYLEKMLIIDKESEVTIYNEGREIFRRTLDPGSYKLEDFVLYTGANIITIHIQPLDGSAPSEQTIEIMYSGSLLPPGEVRFGGAFLMGRETSSVKSSASDVLSLKIGRQYLEYDWKNAVLSGYIKAGISDSLTISSTLALQNYPQDDRGWNPRMALNTELTHANILGTTRYNLNLGEYMNEQDKFGIPRIYARVSHQVSTGWNPISSFNISFTYSNPEETGRDNGHRFSLSTSLSGRIGLFSWSTSLSGSIYSDIPENFSWSWANTLSFSFSRNFWLTGSMMLGGSGVNNVPVVSGRVYATVRFGGGSVSASSGFSDASISANYSSGAHSVSASIGTNDFTRLSDYDVDADYSYNGKWVDVSVGAGTSLAFNDGSANFSLSTTTVFADGLFAVGAYIPSNFLLIRQYDALKGNTLSVGSAGSSRTDSLDSSFGTSVYTGLSSSRGNAFSLYSSNESSFSGTSIFDINVPPSDLYGYVLRLSADAKYAVSGTVTLPDGTLLYNGSSPLYQYSEDEDGTVVLTPTEDYIFTDSDGRFTVSDLVPGRYAFDIMFDSSWILAVFTVEDIEASVSDIQILQQGGISAPEAGSIPDVYSAITYFDFDTVMTSEEFWRMLYPEFEEAI